MGGFNSILQALAPGMMQDQGGQGAAPSGPPPNPAATPPFLPQSPMPQAPVLGPPPNPNAQFETPEAQSALEELTKIAKGKMLDKESASKPANLDDLITKFKGLQGAVQDPAELRQRFMKQYYGIDPTATPTGKQRFGMLLQQLAEGASNTRNPNWQPIQQRATDWAQKAYGEQTQRLSGMEGLLNAQANLEWQRQKQQNDLEQKREVEARKAAQNIASDAIKRGQFAQQTYFQNGKLNVDAYTNELKRHAQEYQEKYGVGIPPQVMELEIAQLRETHPEAYLQLLQHKDFVAWYQNKYKAFGTSSTSGSSITPEGKTLTINERQPQLRPGVTPPQIPGLPNQGGQNAPPSTGSSKPLAMGETKSPQGILNRLDAAGAPGKIAAPIQWSADRALTQNSMALSTVASLVRSGRDKDIFGPWEGNPLMQQYRNMFAKDENSTSMGESLYQILKPTVTLSHLGAVKPGGRLYSSMIQMYEGKSGGEQTQKADVIMHRLLANNMALELTKLDAQGRAPQMTANLMDAAEKKATDYIRAIKSGQNPTIPTIGSILAPPPANSSTTRGNATPKTWEDYKKSRGL